MKIWRNLCLLLIFAVTLFAQSGKIKSGDAIEIVVFGHPELSRIVYVNQQGKIDFPLLQSWPVDGLSLDDLREVIIAKLSSYLNTTPLVTVSLTKINSLNINVLGMVLRPGIIQTPLYSMLQGAISAAGGFSPGARINEVVVRRNVNGKMVSNTYDLEQFIRSNDLAQNPIMEEGDIVLVPGNPLLTNVKVIGAVRSPGLFNLYTGATILEMIMQAGGPLEDADIAKITFISSASTQNLELKVNLAKCLKEHNFTNLPVVKPGDIIYIPKKKNYWQAILNFSRDLSTLVIVVWYVKIIKS